MHRDQTLHKYHRHNIQIHENSNHVSGKVRVPNTFLLFEEVIFNNENRWPMVKNLSLAAPLPFWSLQICTHFTEFFKARDQMQSSFEVKLGPKKLITSFSSPFFRK